MNHPPISYNYAALTYPALLLTTAFLLVRYWNHLPAVARWVRGQYRALPAGMLSMLHGYLAAGFALVWLRVLYWPAWLLVVLSAVPITYTLVRYIVTVRAERRDLNARIKKMLRETRRNALPVLFLAGVLGLAVGYAWLHHIVNHPQP